MGERKPGLLGVLGHGEEKGDVREGGKAMRTGPTSGLITFDEVNTASPASTQEVESKVEVSSVGGTQARVHQSGMVEQL